MIDGLMDALGYVGSSLDKLGPRPVRGLLAGKPRELASWIPFSDDLGLTDPHDISSGRDVTNHLGLTDPSDTSLGSHAAGMLADAIIDPAALYGGAKAAIGAHKGLMKAAKGSVASKGSRLGFNDFVSSNAQDYVGPRYSAREGRDLLWDALNERRAKIDPSEDQIVKNMKMLEAVAPKTARRIYREIPEGSDVLTTGGGEGPVFKTPYGSVVKVGPRTALFGAPDLEAWRSIRGTFPATGRPDIPESLRPIRSNDFGGRKHGIRVEHMHKVEPIHHELDRLMDQVEGLRPHAYAGNVPIGEYNRADTAVTTLDDLNQELTDRFKESIANSYPGYNPFDVNQRNTSLTPDGRLVVHDGGAIVGRNEPIDPFPSASRPPEDLVKQVIASGGPDYVRRMLEEEARNWRPGRSGVPAFSREGKPEDVMAERAELLSLLRSFSAKYGHLLGKKAVRSRAVDSPSKPFAGLGFLMSP